MFSVLRSIFFFFFFANPKWRAYIFNNSFPRSSLCNVILTPSGWIKANFLHQRHKILSMNSERKDTLTFYFVIIKALLSSSRVQEQPSRDVFNKRCSENMQQIYRKTPMPKCGFNKVAKQFYWNHTSAGCSPVNLLHIFRTPFLALLASRNQS